MRKETSSLKQSDLMMINAGWRWTDGEISKEVGQIKLPSLQCRLCRQIALKLRTSAEFFEARATRLAEI
jgi:hypothetical protein